MPVTPVAATQTAEPAIDSPFDPRIPVIRAGSPEFAALAQMSRGVK